MKKAYNNLIFPNKNDYPQSLKLLDNKRSSDLYRQLIESSASAYFETNPLTRYFFQKRFQLVLQLIPREKTKIEILDAGCGIGFFLPTLSRFAEHIWAIDHAGYSIQYAKFMCKKKRLKNISFKKVDLMQSLPFPARKFDLIVCLSVLEHIRNLQMVIKNFRRVLKKDGILIAGYPDEDNFVFQLFQYLEKRILRPKVYMTFQGTKLNHVSKAKKINKVISKYFYVEETNNINLLPGITFYILQKCRL